MILGGKKKEKEQILLDMKRPAQRALLHTERAVQ